MKQWRIISKKKQWWNKSNPDSIDFYIDPLAFTQFFVLTWCVLFLKYKLMSWNHVLSRMNECHISIPLSKHKIDCEWVKFLYLEVMQLCSHFYAIPHFFCLAPIIVCLLDKYHIYHYHVKSSPFLVLPRNKLIANEFPWSTYTKFP